MRKRLFAVVAVGVVALFVWIGPSSMQTPASRPVGQQPARTQPARPQSAIDNRVWANVFPGVANYLYLDMATPGVLFANTSRGVFRTLDGGALWTGFTLFGLDGPGSFAQSEKHPKVMYYGSAGIWKSDDGGGAWNRTGPVSYTHLTLPTIYSV